MPESRARMAGDQGERADAQELVLCVVVWQMARLDRGTAKMNAGKERRSEVRDRLERILMLWPFGAMISEKERPLRLLIRV